MADIQAIAVAANTMRNLLIESSLGDLFPGAQVRNVVVPELRDPPVDLGLSLCLYRVAFNGNRRSLPPRKESHGVTFKPSVPLDLHFLLTAWGNWEKQWALLAWAIRTLEDTPTLHAGLLNDNAGSDADGFPSVVFQEGEMIELVGESLTQQEMQAIWEPAKHNQRPSVSYLLRSVLIDSKISQRTPLAQTRAFDLAPAVP